MPYKPMLAHKIHEKKKHVVFPGAVQPKLDGMRCVSDVGSPDLFSRTGKDIVSVPRLKKLIYKYFPRIATDGELYCHDEFFEDIMSNCRRTKNINEDDRVQYWIYDAYLGGLTFRQRNNILIEAYSHVSAEDRKRIILCPTMPVHSQHEIDAYFKKFLFLGYEGLIYRNLDSLYEVDKRSAYLLKMKPWLDREVTVTGFEEGKGKYVESLGALKCEFFNEDEPTHVYLVKVGGGFTDVQRKDIWTNPYFFCGKVLTIKYQNLTKYGVPRHPIFLRWREPE
jgi:DNA ligase-1